MNSIRVLDVTLRDGGCVNDFNFGQTNMAKILNAQENAGIDFIELGYIDEKAGSVCARTQYANEQCIKNAILRKKRKNVVYVAMMDYGKFNADNLHQRTNDDIDGIRVAFHKKDRKDAINVIRKILDRGYLAFVQPMITLRYSDEELKDLITDVNNKVPDAAGFYIVDSFGEMRPNDMQHIFKLVDEYLLKTMTLGFHSHNNIQMSYSNAIAFLNYPTNRSLLLDSSIMGMGKGAGNLNTELLLQHLNLYFGKQYNIAPLLQIIDKVINPLHSEFYWGYAPEYYLSSVNHCTPTYASHFYNKHMLPIDQVGELLSMIDEKKKISFDKQYAENLYREYNEKKTIIDNDVIDEFRELIKNKDILLVAPGKSIIGARQKIQSLCTQENVFVIGLNLFDNFNFDYSLITRKEVYDEAILGNRNIIVVSNVSKGGRGNVKIIDYGKWINQDEDGIHDSSSVVAFNLLKACGVKNIMLAGFDGFSDSINANYYKSDRRYPMSEMQAKMRNVYQKKLIRDLIDSEIQVNFITPSLYDSF